MMKTNYFNNLLVSVKRDSRFLNRQVHLLKMEVDLSERFKDLRESKVYREAVHRWLNSNYNAEQIKDNAMHVVELIRDAAKQRDPEVAEQLAKQIEAHLHRKYPIINSQYATSIKSKRNPKHPDTLHCHITTNDPEMVALFTRLEKELGHE